MANSMIVSLREKRNTLWNQTKDFLEEHRGIFGVDIWDARRRKDVDTLLVLRITILEWL